ncbi:MAG: hypothetical protein GXP53_07920 [Deltaproteobacteria bacterium]|nr:hypothetical protein [Deltaproteobacteria bacterium]
MKKKSLIISASLLALLFSALVFSAIRLFTHHAIPIEPATAVKKSTAMTKAPARQTTAKAMTGSREKIENRPGGKAVTAPESPSMEPPPADSEENRLEMARMKEKLAGNMWIPEDPRFGVDPERSERLGKSIILADKIRKGTATPKEKSEYYTFKIKSVQDRIDIIKYIADRTAELGKTSKKTYLTSQDRVVGEKKIAQFEKEINGYREMLKKIGPEANMSSGE